MTKIEGRFISSQERTQAPLESEDMAPNGGNGRNGRIYLIGQTVAGAIAFALIGAIGWMWSVVISDTNRITALERYVDDTNHRIDGYIAIDNQWKKDEKDYDAEIRASTRLETQNINQVLQHINDRVNAIAIAKGLSTAP